MLNVQHTKNFFILKIYVIDQVILLGFFIWIIYLGGIFFWELKNRTSDFSTIIKCSNTSLVLKSRSSQSLAGTSILYWTKLSFYPEVQFLSVPPAPLVLSLSHGLMNLSGSTFLTFRGSFSSACGFWGGDVILHFLINLYFLGKTIWIYILKVNKYLKSLLDLFLASISLEH